MKVERILHIELGAEHGDVIAWMRSLPERTINQTVNEILSSESRSKIRRIPHQFSSTNEQAPLSCKLVIRDTAALDFVAKIPKGEIKNTLVKVIRKHIRKNQELPPELVGIHGEMFLTKLGEFIEKAKAKEFEYAGVPNKYSKLCEANEKAYCALLDEILSCYKSVDENQGDANLRALDCDKIIQSVFESVFGIIEMPLAPVANCSRDDNSNSANTVPAANENTPLFVSDEEPDWWDEDYNEDDV